MVKALTFLAEGFEEVEAIAVTDLLLRAGMEVKCISISETRTVEGAHGIHINAHNLITEIKEYDADLLFLPGGMPGTANLEKNEIVKEMLIKAAQQDKMIAAICAAPSILGKLGLLEGKKATCFPGFEEFLKGAEILSDKVVVDGNIITSRGMGTALDLGLKLVELFYDSVVSQKLAETIQYA